MKIIIHQQQWRTLLTTVGYVFKSVCLSVCPTDNWKSCERILTKFLGAVGHGPGTNEFNFGDDLDHRPDLGVRNPHSMDYRKSYQRILMESWETNWLHFGVDPPIQPPLLSISIKFLTCKFHHVPFTANFHYLQIQSPLLPKSITCNFSAPYKYRQDNSCNNNTCLIITVLDCTDNN